jgi:hypothetical protein
VLLGYSRNDNHNLPDLLVTYALHIIVVQVGADLHIDIWRRFARCHRLPWREIERLHPRFTVGAGVMTDPLVVIGVAFWTVKPASVVNDRPSARAITEAFQNAYTSTTYAQPVLISGREIALSCLMIRRRF